MWCKDNINILVDEEKAVPLHRIFAKQHFLIIFLV